MSMKLKFCIIIFSLFLTFVTSYLLKNEKLSVKYSLLWYFIAIILIIVSIFPTPLLFLQSIIGFESMSNMIIGIILCLLVFSNLFLTIVVSSQKQKINLLIQEVSILKNERK